MKDMTYFENEVNRIASGTPYKAGKDYLLYVLDSSDTLRLEVVEREKKGGPFRNVLAGDWGGSFSSDNEDGYTDIEYLIYQVKYEEGGAVFTVVFMSKDYTGYFEESNLPENIKAKLLECMPKQKEHVDVIITEAGDTLTKTSLDDVVSIEAILSLAVDYEKEEFHQYIKDAIKMLVAGDIQFRTGLYLLTKFYANSLFKGLEFLGFSYKYCNKLSYSWSCKQLYDYLVQEVKKQCPEFIEPISNELNDKENGVLHGEEYAAQENAGENSLQTEELAFDNAVADLLDVNNKERARAGLALLISEREQARYKGLELLNYSIALRHALKNEKASRELYNQIIDEVRREDIWFAIPTAQEAYDYKIKCSAKVSEVKYVTMSVEQQPIFNTALLNMSISELVVYLKEKVSNEFIVTYLKSIIKAKEFLFKHTINYTLSSVIEALEASSIDDEKIIEVAMHIDEQKQRLIKDDAKVEIDSENLMHASITELIRISRDKGYNDSEIVTLIKVKDIKNIIEGVQDDGLIHSLSTSSKPASEIINILLQLEKIETVMKQIGKTIDWPFKAQISEVLLEMGEVEPAVTVSILKLVIELKEIGVNFEAK